MAHIALGITGSISAYKAGDIIRLLRKQGHDVTCVMSACALKFLGETTCRALSGRPVITDLFDPREGEILHTALAGEADAVLVAPATAQCLAKYAHGLADDALSCLLLATQAPVFLAPAMNVHMWEHEAVQSNVARLKSRGAIFIGPVEGDLACGYAGMGHLAEPEAIAEAVLAALGHGR